MAVLDWEYVAGLVYAVGLRGETAATAVAVTEPESGRDPDKHNANARTGDDSWGLWQINMIGDLGPDRRGSLGLLLNAQLLDPYTNARGMMLVSGGGNSFGPWTTYKNGLHVPFMGLARAAVAAVEARGGNPGTGTATPGGAVGPAVDLGRSGDVTGGLPGAIDPNRLTVPSALWGDNLVVRGQVAARTILADTLLGGSVDAGVADLAELTLEVGAYPLNLARVSDALELGATADWLDLRLRIVGGEWSEGDGGMPVYTIRCRPAGAETMRERAGNLEQSWDGMSPTEVMDNRATAAGMRFVGEGSNRRDLITRKGPKDGGYQAPTSASTDTESDWDLGQRLADEEGYWCFESAGTLYFARPSWLVTRMPRFDVNPAAGLGGVDDVDRSYSGTFGLPSARRTREDDLLPGMETRNITVKLPRNRGEQVRPGMVAAFAGLPLFDGDYLVARVSFPLDGGTEPATVELVEPVDPVPNPPDDPSATAAADGTGTTGATSSAGPVGTAGASALDMVTVALRQIGKNYVYGAEAAPDDPDPQAFDCSELVQWACAQVGVTFTDQSEAQMAAVEAAGLPNPPHGLAVAECRNIRGALLWHPGHVAISLGDGVHTIEAMGRQYGVVQGNIGARFNKGGLIPGLVYPPLAAAAA